MALSLSNQSFCRCELLLKSLCNQESIQVLLGDQSVERMYNSVLPHERGYIPMFTGRYLVRHEDGEFSYESILEHNDPFQIEEVKRRLCVWNLRQELRVNVAQISTADTYMGDMNMLGQEWNEQLLQTVRCLAKKHREVEVLGVESIPIITNDEYHDSASTQFEENNNISGLDALRRICEGTGVHSITCMDVGPSSRVEKASLEDIVRVCCNELQVNKLTICEYRGRADMYSNFAGLQKSYPHYNFFKGYCNGRYIYTMEAKPVCNIH